MFFNTYYIMIVEHNSRCSQHSKHDSYVKYVDSQNLNTKFDILLELLYILIVGSYHARKISCKCHIGIILRNYLTSLLIAIKDRSAMIFMYSKSTSGLPQLPRSDSSQTVYHAVTRHKACHYAVCDKAMTKLS